LDAHSLQKRERWRKDTIAPNKNKGKNTNLPHKRKKGRIHWREQLEGKKQPPKKRQQMKCSLLPNKASELRMKKKMKQGNLTRSPLLAAIHPSIETGNPIPNTVSSQI